MGFYRRADDDRISAGFCGWNSAGSPIRQPALQTLSSLPLNLEHAWSREAQGELTDVFLWNVAASFRRWRGILTTVMRIRDGWTSESADDNKSAWMGFLCLTSL